MNDFHRIKRAVLFEYLEKYRDTSSRALSRMISKDHPEFFKDAEFARNEIRLYRGARGDAFRKKITITKFYKYEPVARKF